jgi:hypothetical protein
MMTTSNIFFSSSKVVLPQPLKVAQTTLAPSRMSTQDREYRELDESRRVKLSREMNWTRGCMTLVDPKRTTAPSMGL